METILKQVKAKGYLTLQELTQFNNIEVYLTIKLSETLNKPISKILEEVKIRSVTYEQVVKALKINPSESQRGFD